MHGAYNLQNAVMVYNKNASQYYAHRRAKYPIWIYKGDLDNWRNRRKIEQQYMDHADTGAKILLTDHPVAFGAANGAPLCAALYRKAPQKQWRY